MPYSRLPKEWAALLPPQAIAAASELADRAQAEQQAGRTICPPLQDIFRAYHLTPPERVSCVIWGQDPYPTIGHAMGLAFGVQRGVALPRSLRNIYKELTSDLGVNAPEHGDLTQWGAEGVLLLNTVLTVESGAANSHAAWGWQTLTSETLRICAGLPQPVVFVLWGGQAQKVAASVGLTPDMNNVIASAHPSPLSARRGFFGSKPFSQVNSKLSSLGGTPIDWRIKA